MLKSLLKSCLAVAMIGAMSAPTFAADVKTAVNGRVRASLLNVNIKDGSARTDMISDSRLGGSVSGVAGAWTVTAFTNVDINYLGVPGVNARDQKITLENADIAINIGRFVPWGVTPGGWDYTGGYMTGEELVNNSFWAGENMTVYRDDFIQVGFKSIGLNLVLGMNHLNASDTTGDERNVQTVGVIYSGTFGPVSVGAQYVSEGSTIDEKDGDADTTSDTYNGATYSSMALGVKYAISESMAVSFDYESGTSKTGATSAEAINTTIMELFFDMAIDEQSGVSVGYSSKAVDDGSDNVVSDTIMNLAYSMIVGPARVYASYYNTTSKDANNTVDTATSKLGLGAVVAF
ncbi:porin [bacterium]|nr:porin [bacterium]